MSFVSRSRSATSGAGFIGVLSMTMALTALAVDLMLPAFADMREAFDLAPDATAVAGVVTTFLLGLAIGPLPYGLAADRFGRKPVLYFGFAMYALGAVGSAIAPSLTWLFVARFVWGVGAAGPRVLALTIVRDVYEGERMARAMSFIMAVFILVPVIAPSAGALIVAIAPWRAVFWFCVLFVVAVAAWALRIPETLDPTNRIAPRLDDVIRTARTVLTSRHTMGYTVAMTFLFGVFVSYLASSEIIVTEVFDRGPLFPFVFGGLALVMGGAILTNAAIVRTVGTRRLLHLGLLAYMVVGALLVLIAIGTDGSPPFPVFLASFAVMLSLHSVLIPNINTIAMGPMGRVAGTASAVMGTISTAGGALLGALIDQAFDGTITPLSVAFLATGAAATAAALWTERGHLAIRSGAPTPAAAPTTGGGA